MGIFKSITKVLKKAAPIIGGAIGFSMGTPFLGTALGTGIGTLVAGGDAEDAVKAGLMGGIAGYAGNQFFGPAAAKATGPMGNPVSGNVGNVVAPTFISKVKDFATSGPGIATIAGLGTLGALGMEEEPKDETKIREYPKGEVVFLGSNKIYNAKDDKTYDLNDKDDREAYFKALLEQDEEKRKKEDDDEVISMASGGLAQIRDTLNQGIMRGVMPLKDQIDPFLDQINEMATQKFGVSLRGSGFGDGLGFPSQLPGLSGGLGMSNANQLKDNFLTDLKNQSDLFNQNNQTGSNAFAPSGSRLDFGAVNPDGSNAYPNTDVELQYVQTDQGEGIDQFGRPMRDVAPNPTEGMTDEEKAQFFGNIFGEGFSRGVTNAGASPFGAGQARKSGLNSAITGLGSIANYMNEGGEVNGPGTGTSDSVPARLSDGEFVLTAQAVRGAGGGDRDLGAARMYDMMSQLERIA
tara:strand:+ start:4693 stop:6084 length:1392 start_codon:yes stop_codon:yes gene_type:complete